MEQTVKPHSTTARCNVHADRAEARIGVHPRSSKPPAVARMRVRDDPVRRRRRLLRSVPSVGRVSDPRLSDNFDRLVDATIRKQDVDARGNVAPNVRYRDAAAHHQYGYAIKLTQIRPASQRGSNKLPDDPCCAVGKDRCRLRRWLSWPGSDREGPTRSTAFH